MESFLRNIHPDRPEYQADENLLEEDKNLSYDKTLVPVQLQHSSYYHDPRLLTRYLGLITIKVNKTQQADGPHNMHPQKNWKISLDLPLCATHFKDLSYNKTPRTTTK